MLISRRSAVRPCEYSKRRPLKTVIEDLFQPLPDCGYVHVGYSRFRRVVALSTPLTSECTNSSQRLFSLYGRGLSSCEVNSLRYSLAYYSSARWCSCYTSPSPGCTRSQFSSELPGPARRATSPGNMSFLVRQVPASARPRPRCSHHVRLLAGTCCHGPHLHGNDALQGSFSSEYIQWELRD